MKGGAEATPCTNKNALKDFPVHKAQLLNILNLKSSSFQQRNFQPAMFYSHAIAVAGKNVVASRQCKKSHGRRNENQ